MGQLERGSRELSGLHAFSAEEAERSEPIVQKLLESAETVAVFDTHDGAGRQHFEHWLTEQSSRREVEVTVFEDVRIYRDQPRFREPGWRTALTHVRPDLPGR